MCVFRELWEDPSPPAPIPCEALEAFCEENSSSCAEEREVLPWPREAAVSPWERETAALPPLGPGSEHGAGLRSRLIMVSGGMMVFQPCSWWLKECHWTLGEVWGVQHVRPAEEPCGGCPALPVWSNPVPHRELQTPGQPLAGHPGVPGYPAPFGKLHQR